MQSSIPILTDSIFLDLKTKLTCLIKKEKLRLTFWQHLTHIEEEYVHNNIHYYASISSFLDRSMVIIQLSEKMNCFPDEIQSHIFDMVGISLDDLKPILQSTSYHVFCEDLCHFKNESSFNYLIGLCIECGMNIPQMLKDPGTYHDSYYSVGHGYNKILYLGTLGNNILLVRLCLDNGISPEEGRHRLGSRQKKPMTPLGNAVVNDNLEIAQLLMEKGANAKIKGTYQSSLLHYAQSPTMMDFLLEKTKWSINQKDSNGCTPFYYITLRYYIFHMLQLIRNKKMNECIASTNSYYILDDNLLDISFQNIKNEKPYKLFVENLFSNPIHPNILQYMLEKGANPAIQSKLNYTVVHIAACIPDFPLATMKQILSKCSTSVLKVKVVEEEEEKTPFELACKYNISIQNELIEYLFQMEVKGNWPAFHEKSLPLFDHVANTLQYRITLKTLVKDGINMIHSKFTLLLKYAFPNVSKIQLYFLLLLGTEHNASKISSKMNILDTDRKKIRDCIHTWCTRMTNKVNAKYVLDIVNRMEKHLLLIVGSHEEYLAINDSNIESYIKKNLIYQPKFSIFWCILLLTQDSLPFRRRLDKIYTFIQDLKEQARMFETNLMHLICRYIVQTKRYTSLAEFMEKMATATLPMAMPIKRKWKEIYLDESFRPIYLTITQDHIESIRLSIIYKLFCAAQNWAFFEDYYASL